MVELIQFAALGPIDDDVRLTWVGEDGSRQVLSDTQWNLGWYYGDVFVGPGGDRPDDAGQYRRISLFAPEVSLPGRILVEAFDGWATRWETSPWMIQVRHDDGHTEGFFGGESRVGTSPHSGGGSGYYATGPHYNDYRELGETGVIQDRSPDPPDPGEPFDPVDPIVLIDWPEALKLARSGRYVRRSWWTGDKAITFARGEGNVPAVAVVRRNGILRPLRATDFTRADYFATDWVVD